MRSITMVSLRHTGTAVWHGRTDIISALIAGGANGHEVDSTGATVLHFAAMKGHPGIVSMLSLAGAHVREKDGAAVMTALHIAAYGGHTETILTLLAAEVDVHEKDNRGFTALNWAAWHGHAEIVAALLTAGASVLEKDVENESAVWEGCLTVWPLHANPEH